MTKPPSTTPQETKSPVYRQSSGYTTISEKHRSTQYPGCYVAGVKSTMQLQQIDTYHQPDIDPGSKNGHILGNCHSTGCSEYGALSYAMAIVPKSAKRAMNTISSTRMVSLSTIIEMSDEKKYSYIDSLKVDQILTRYISRCRQRAIR